MKQRQEKCDNKVYLKQHWNIKYTREMWLSPGHFQLSIPFPVSMFPFWEKKISILCPDRKKVVKNFAKMANDLQSSR